MLRPPGRPLFLASGLLACAALARPSFAYVDLAPTIVKVLDDSRTIAVVQLTSIDRQKRTVTFKEVKVLKGTSGTTPLVQPVAAGANAIIPRPILQWAEPGAEAVVFSSTRTALICIGPYWYQLNLSGSNWKLGPDRVELALTYCGSVARLAQGIETILAGGDAILTMMPHDVDRNASFDLALNRLAYPGLVTLERIRANLQMPNTVWNVSNSRNYLIGLGPVDESDLPALVRQLQTGDSAARAGAAEDIRELTEVVGAARTAGTVPALEKLLSDSSPRVRTLAAAAVLRITHGHAAALKVLADGLASPDATTRRDAAIAAAVTGRAGEPLVAALARLLQDADDVKFAALQAIGTLGPVALGARAAVIPLLDSPDDMIDAADALGRMGPGARPIPPAMTKMLASNQAGVRMAALRGMSQIGGKEALPAAEYIARNVGSANEIDAFNMTEMLALIGPVARVPAASIQSVPIPNPAVLSATNWAIHAPAAFPWQDANIDDLGDLFSFVWATYVLELGERLRPCALSLAPQLMNGTAGDVPDWGYQILNAAPTESIAVIAPHLADKDKAKRERAAIALGRMGPPAIAARPKLEAAIAAAIDPREKNLLAWALREITKD
jgi:HEAT repeat protein